MKYYDDYYIDISNIIKFNKLNKEIDKKIDYRELANSCKLKIKSLKGDFNSNNFYIIEKKIKLLNEDFEYYNYYASLLIIYNNYRNELIPQIDIHGLYHSECKTIVTCIIEIWKEQKVKKCSIITGKFKKNSLYGIVENILNKNKIKFKLINIGQFLVKLI